MSTDPRTVSAAYFEAWLGKDFDRLRALLADDATFEGPLASIDNADDCVKGLQGMSEIVTDIEIEKVFVDGEDVLTWFALHNSVAPAAQTVNWQKVVDGKIVAIRVLFDPREIVAAG